jgi:pimeloyl-ACP methyl ester carboxylesterase
MRRPQPTGLAIFAGMLLLPVVAGGARAAPADWSTAASPSPIATPAAPTTNPPGLVPTTCTTPVPARARCATLWVPLDYAHPALGTIPTAVVIVPALDPAQRLGSLLLNPGGPGESGVEFVADQYAEFSALNERFDLVGFDPRGTTGSDAVACESTQGLDHNIGIDPMASGNPSREADLVATSLAFADACRLHSGALLAHVSTADAARDMDALRAALGDAKLSYLGFSYGTYLGAVYASLFPTHIRAMVLDGDLDPSLDFLDLSVQQGASFEASYQEFVSRCAQLAACPLGATPDATITSLLTGLAARPLTAPDGRSVGRGLALTALVAAMYVPDDWGIFYAAFSQAAHGNVAPLESLADALTGRGPSGFDHSIEANAAINCADHAVPESLAAYDSRAAQVAAQEPHFGQEEVYSVLACAFWAVHGPPPAPLHVTTAPPILLVGATHDPATPYAWSQSLARQLKGAVLLTREGYGHTSYEFSACVRAAVDAYLEGLTLPAAGTVCPTP